MAKKLVKPLEKGDKKTTKAEMEARVAEVCTLITENKNSKQIVEICTKKFGVADSTVRKYYTTAMEEIRKQQSPEIKDFVAVELARLERDLHYAYNIHQNCADPVLHLRWFNIYLDIKSRIKAFYPELADTSVTSQNNTQVIINIDSDDVEL